MKIEILTSARDDIRDARYFYERQGGPELGEYFFDTVCSHIESLRFYAGVFRRKYGFYWMPVRHFPYSVYYDIVDGLVRIYAVVDNRRDPDWIVAHLDDVN